MTLGYKNKDFDYFKYQKYILSRFFFKEFSPVVHNTSPIDAVRTFFLLINFSVGLRIFLMELSKKNP